MKRIICFVLCIAFSFALVSCASKLDSSYGDPVNAIAKAVKNCDAKTYLLAFEENYIKDLEEYYLLISDEGLEATVQETLEFTADNNKSNYGMGTAVSLTEKSKTVLDKFPEDAVYSGEFTPGGEVEEILSLTVSYVIEGFNGSSRQNEATFIVYSVDGTYYLHPMHLMFVFQ